MYDIFWRESETGNSVLVGLCSIIDYLCQHQTYFFPFALGFSANVDGILYLRRTERY